MTQLAALSRAAGVEPAAERRLLEALGCVPDHIPAIVALADFYADADALERPRGVPARDPRRHAARRARPPR